MDAKKRADRTTLPCEKRYSGAAGGSPEPALTILYHPDPARIGERALLYGLAAGKRVEVSRNEPVFARPTEGGRGDVGRVERVGEAGGWTGLDEPHLSRRPFR